MGHPQPKWDPTMFGFCEGGESIVLLAINGYLMVTSSNVDKGYPMVD